MSRLSLLILVIVLMAQSGCVSTSRKGYSWGLSEFTGGMSVICSREFGSQFSVQMADGMAFDAWLTPLTVKVNIPFLLHCDVDRAPYRLGLEIWDESKQYQSIEIREVLLEYQDGKCVCTSVDWKQTLKPYTQHHSCRFGRTEKEMIQMGGFMADFKEEIACRHQDVRITLSGNMININGEPIAFSTPIEFKAKSSFMVAPTWLILSGV